MSIIELKNVSYSYAESESVSTLALKNLSLNIQEGEFVALVGHNGSGKSTLAKLFNGLILPDDGTVTVDGMLTTDKSKLFDIRKTVSVVFQNPDNQMIATIIEDDIAFGPENLGLEPAKISERVTWALESVGMLEHRMGTPFRLSGGQKQRIAIAGVLAIAPRVMVLDESTAMLDPVGRAEVMSVVKKLNKENKMTIIMITHFMEEAAEADRIIVLSGGEILMEGGRELFLRGAELESVGLDVPLYTSVAGSLADSGLDVARDIVTLDELVEAICR